MWFRYFLIISVLLTSPYSIFAGQGELENFYNNRGFMSNQTDSGAFKDQYSGGWTGGRTNVTTAVQGLPSKNLFEYDPPTWSGSCNRLNFSLGGIAYANLSGIGGFMRQMANNVGMILFTEALDKSSEFGTGLIKKAIGLSSSSTSMTGTKLLSAFQTSQQFGFHERNSCQAAQALVKNMKEIIRENYEQKHAKNEGGQSFINALMSTGIKDQDSLLKKVSDNYKNYNLTWNAISHKQSRLLKNEDQITRQLMLSLLGTVIIENGKPRIYYPLRNAYKALMYGGTSDTYSCVGDSGCLKMVHAAIEYPKSGSLMSLVEGTLKDIQKTILYGTEPTTEHINLINSTELPIYKLINVKTAWMKGIPHEIDAGYIKAIAYNILSTFMQSVIDEQRMLNTKIDVPGPTSELIDQLIKEEQKVLYDILQEERDLSENTEEIVERARILEIKVYDRETKVSNI